MKAHDTERHSYNSERHEGENIVRDRYGRVKCKLGKLALKNKTDVITLLL